MRCLTLADALKQRGAQVRFVSRHMPENFRASLRSKGHGFKFLTSSRDGAAIDDVAHSHWLGVSQADDAAETSEALSDQAWDWLIVDHYALDARWETSARPLVKSILVIDDIADRSHDCDVLLDQNFYDDMNERYVGKVPAHCSLLLGPRYALLRQEFRDARKQAKPRSGSVKRILVFFGGVDADNYTALAIKALGRIEFSEVHVHVDVVIGAQHPYRDQIEMTCAEQAFTCHVQTDRMAELMTAADLAIGAGGSATWERCCLGLPTLTICTAENQKSQIFDAASHALLYAPEFEGDTIQAIQRHLFALFENESLRRAVSRNGMREVDGRGTLRVGSSLGCSSIEIRVARPDDSERLFEWRNHVSIREVSFSSAPISIENHQKWFSMVLDDANRLLLVGHREGAAVGVVRFDILGDEAEVSIYVVPHRAESGLGRDLLQSAESWVASHRPDVAQIRALVLGVNERSHRLFLSAGYHVSSCSYLRKVR